MILKKIIFICFLMLSVNSNEMNLKNEDSFGSDEDRKFLVDSPGCQIPSFRIYHQDKFSDYTCGERQVLVQKVTEDKIHFKMLKSFDDCCYYYYKGSGDRARSSTKCLPVKNDTTIVFLYEFISVHCNKQNVSTEDYYAFVKKVKNVEKNTDQSWNIIILGIDTMSRARAYNSLTETVAYMRKNQWLDYRGYNKVGLDTASNLIPLLTGRTKDSFYDFLRLNNCTSNMYKCNDQIIWHQFQKHGYVTAFGEDIVDLESVFEYNISRFRTAPTHHYLRPLSKLAEEGGFLQCIGEISSATQILKYAENFVNTYKLGKFFGFFWVSSHRQNESQSPKNLDNKILNFLKKLQSLGVLSNTFVFFISDHGMRYGPVRYVIQEFYENKLPMFFMWTPPMFQDSHPTRYSNLMRNQKTLLSPYDLHLTLQDILKISDNTFSRRRADGCPKCKSLFKKISDSRACSEAAIIEPFCSCHTMTRVSVSDDKFTHIIRKAVDYVHNKSLTINTHKCTRCLEASFERLFRIHSYSFGEDTYYIVAFLTSPSRAVYQVIVRGSSLYDSYVYNIHSSETFSERYHEGYCVKNSRDRYLCVCERIPSCLS